MRKSIIAITLLTTLATVYLYVRSRGTDTVDRSERIITSVVGNNPTFLHDNKSIIKINNLKEFDDGWVLTDIGSLKEITTKVPVYVILKEEDNYYKTILGPDTHFTEAEMLRYNIPDPIIREFSNL